MEIKISMNHYKKFKKLKISQQIFKRGSLIKNNIIYKSKMINEK